jgi:hypothetical protein
VQEHPTFALQVTVVMAECLRRANERVPRPLGSTSCARTSGE